eukprot:1139168-Pelagomonas_calceolata.AAC.1
MDTRQAVRRDSPRAARQTRVFTIGLVVQGCRCLGSNSNAMPQIHTLIKTWRKQSSVPCRLWESCE